MRGDIVDQATVTGALLIVYSPNNDSDLHYIASINSIDQGLGKNIDTSINVTGLTGTEYGVSVFAMENGWPFPRVVISPLSVNVAGIEGQSMYSVLMCAP